MPYILKKQKTRGYKVCKRGTRKCFSKRPLTKRMAKRQMRALYLHERVGKGHRTRHNLRGGGFVVYVNGNDFVVDANDTIEKLIRKVCEQFKREYSPNIKLRYVGGNHSNDDDFYLHERTLSDIGVNTNDNKLRITFNN